MAESVARLVWIGLAVQVPHSIAPSLFLNKTQLVSRILLPLFNPQPIPKPS